jgi:uncharacterized membrane protein
MIPELTITRPAVRGARLWEIDTLRGIAVVAMVIYHFTWDLFYFGVLPINMTEGTPQIIARTIGTTFIGLLGLSATLTAARMRRTHGDNADGAIVRALVLRGLLIFGCGLIITIATYLFNPRSFVVFGVLHLLGLALILIVPFLRWRGWVSLVAGLATIVIGRVLDGIETGSPWLTGLGFKFLGFYMSDWYPLFPWVGVALIGVWLGKTLYPDGKRSYGLGDASGNPLVRGLSWLGQHSLIIYLVHQPVIIGTLTALGVGRS